MTLRMDQDAFVVETFDCFKDDSGRANYHSLFKMERIGNAEPVPAGGEISSVEIISGESATSTFRPGDGANALIQK